ncbi:hypothetical protein BGZ95_001435, partial [Linnemannia exigua]
MRIISITLAISLALVAVTKAAPLPTAKPAITEMLIFKRQDCLEDCYQVQQECLLNAETVSGCVADFATCHDQCNSSVTPVPEEVQLQDETPNNSTPDLSVDPSTTDPEENVDPSVAEPEETDPEENEDPS